MDNLTKWVLPLDLDQSTSVNDGHKQNPLFLKSIDDTISVHEPLSKLTVANLRDNPP